MITRQLSVFAAVFLFSGVSFSQTVQVAPESGWADDPPVIDSLKQAGYRRGVHIELSRHSHNAAQIVKQSYEFLAPIIRDVMAEDI